ncbi:MAG: hypothetical protein ACOYBE_05305 [Blautia sp.]|jgi:hypothetical protein
MGGEFTKLLEKTQSFQRLAVDFYAAGLYNIEIVPCFYFAAFGMQKRLVRREPSAASAKQGKEEERNG